MKQLGRKGNFMSFYTERRGIQRRQSTGELKAPAHSSSSQELCFPVVGKQTSSFFRSQDQKIWVFIFVTKRMQLQIGIWIGNASYLRHSLCGLSFIKVVTFLKGESDFWFRTSLPRAWELASPSEPSVMYPSSVWTANGRGTNDLRVWWLQQ